MTKQSPFRQLLAEIARKHMHIPTLEERKSDSLDFHSVSVWSVENALLAAFEAGVAAGSELAPRD